MTCLLSCSNKNGGILIADSWNHLAFDPCRQANRIDKIAYSTGNAIAIGQTGVNTIRKRNGVSLRIRNVMQSVCDSFDPSNVEAMQYNLYSGTRHFLHQLSINHSQPSAIVEYIVLYYDGQMVQQRMYRYLREYYKNMRGEWEYAETSRNLTHDFKGFQFGALGTYGLECRFKNRSKDFSDYTMDHIKTFLLQEAREQVRREASFQDQQRQVGPPLTIITMDTKGRIQADITQ